MANHDDQGCAIISELTYQDGSYADVWCGCTITGEGLPAWVREQSIEGAPGIALMGEEG